MLPIPKYSALFNIRYHSFDAALRDARTLMDVQAASVETIDLRVLALARNDIVWDEVSEFFPDDPEGPAEGVNLVEIFASDASDLEDQLGRITDKLEREGRTHGRRGFTIARSEEGEKHAKPGRASHTARAFGAGVQDNVRLAEDGDEAEGDGPRLAFSAPLKAVERIWGMRKKAVGLLGNMQGGRRPIPFVEDTAVPPEHLADYIAEFRAALDRRGLIYGMFGHVDAGVLHVRPAIDMTDPAQETLIREITDEVAALTQKYGGVLWGEHGKGVRSEYAPDLLRPALSVPAADQGRLRPSQPAQPGQDRGPDRRQPLTHRWGSELVARATADPCRDPGGLRQRASLQRQWRLLQLGPGRRHVPVLERNAAAPPLAKGPGPAYARVAETARGQGVDPVEESRRLRRNAVWRTLPARIRNTLARRRGEPDFSHEVKEALDGCLACKSCVGQCPIKVNVPAFRSKFFELYYGRYLRPIRDYVVASIEHSVPWMARMPGLANALSGSGPAPCHPAGDRPRPNADAVWREHRPRTPKA